MPPQRSLNESSSVLQIPVFSGQLHDMIPQVLHHDGLLLFNYCNALMKLLVFSNDSIVRTSLLRTVCPRGLVASRSGDVK